TSLSTSCCRNRLSVSTVPSSFVGSIQSSLDREEPTLPSKGVWPGDGRFSGLHPTHAATRSKPRTHGRNITASRSSVAEQDTDHRTDSEGSTGTVKERTATPALVALSLDTQLVSRTGTRIIAGHGHQVAAQPGLRTSARLPAPVARGGRPHPAPAGRPP